MRRLCVVAVLLVLSVAATAASRLPRPWFLAGNDAAHYDACIESTSIASALALSSSPGAGKGFGAIMQTFPATAYRGKRMRLSALVQSKGVSQWAGLWMRVDGAGRPSPTLAFDNMQSRPIKGSTDWKRYEVTLDVAQCAEEINLGVLLTGEGKVWMTEIRFEPVESAPAPGK